MDAAAPVSHRRIEPVDRHRTPARTLRQRPLFGRAPPRDALRVFAMKPITEILATMEYGPSPASTAEAQAWLDRHQRRLGLFTANQRSEESRVGQECVSTCRSRWSPRHERYKYGYNALIP